MLDDATDIIEALSSLLWPMIAIVVLMMFRKQLLARMEDLTSLKLPWAELNFAMNELARAERTAASASPRDRRGAVARARAAKQFCRGRHILWVDDHPSNNEALAEAIKRLLDVDFDFAVGTEEALECLRKAPLTDVVITDMRRGGNSTAGLELLEAMRAQELERPTIVYVAQLDDQPTPLGAFAVTNRPDELINSLIDIFERAYWRQG